MFNSSMKILSNHICEDSLSNTICKFILVAELSTVTVEELTQHKNYLKVVRRQEREMKAAEKKYQKKTEDLTQKYSDTFKAIKKKVSVKKTS